MNIFCLFRTRQSGSPLRLLVMTAIITVTVSCVNTEIHISEIADDHLRLCAPGFLETIETQDEQLAELIQRSIADRDSMTGELCVEEVGEASQTANNHIQHYVSYYEDGLEYDPPETQPEKTEAQKIYNAAVNDQATIQALANVRQISSRDRGKRLLEVLLVAEHSKVRKESVVFLREFIRNYEWPTRSSYGAATAKNFWILVQHADADVQLQVELLQQAEEAASHGEIDLASLAYLTDRVRVNTDRPQVYGTQSKGKCTQAQTVELYPIEDESTVAQRRETAGLEPLDLYVEDLSKTIGCQAR